MRYEIMTWVRRTGRDKFARSRDDLIYVTLLTHCFEFDVSRLLH